MSNDKIMYLRNNRDDWTSPSSSQSNYNYDWTSPSSSSSQSNYYHAEEEDPTVALIGLGAGLFITILICAFCSGEILMAIGCFKIVIGTFAAAHTIMAVGGDAGVASGLLVFLAYAIAGSIWIGIGMQKKEWKAWEEVQRDREERRLQRQLQERNDPTTKGGTKKSKKNTKKGSKKGAKKKGTGKASACTYELV